MSIKEPTLQDLLYYFPTIELPITLHSELHHVFSKENKPLPVNLSSRFLDFHKMDDDYTEYVPCFALKAEKQFIPIVFWKASLLEYQYVLATFDPRGGLISHQIIAGSKSNGDSILKRIATIDEDRMIIIAEGVGPIDERNYQANKSNTYQLEIAPTGDILQSIIEN